ncbi:MAG: DNA mismatch repair protein MutS [Candidatus Margulisiibacteriota bacterium]
MQKTTPMVSQYQQIKARHKDAVLFFRLGDFYEMFEDDALLASRELEITLTGRGHGESRMPMCGVPHHAARGYIAKLVEKGYKVAVCDQVEDPKSALGVVKREVVNIFTPGTLIEAEMLPQKENNYLAAVNREGKNFGLAFADISTGEFKITEFSSPDDLQDEIQRVSPSEIIISDMLEQNVGQGPRPELGRRLVPCRPSIYKDIYDQETARRKLKDHFGVASLESFGILEMPAGLSAAAAVLDYLKETQKTNLSHINRVQPYRPTDSMFIDQATRRNLELTETMRDKSLKGSLLWVLDQTRTNMGSRLLRRYLLQPLLDKRQIETRLDAVAELFGSPSMREKLGGLLDRVYDIERLASKISTGRANARDLIALKDSLACLPQIKHLLSGSASGRLSEFCSLPDAEDVVRVVNASIVEEPPLAIKEGGIIRQGYNAELDELRSAAHGGKAWILELENKERLRSGIKSLKVGYTRVFGYYIEISNANRDLVPQDYIRKQTLVNAERYITPELKEKESFILNADERMKEMEYKLFSAVRDSIAGCTPDLQKIAGKLSELDVFLSLAQVAAAGNYCRPVFGEKEMLVKLSRHPVVEKMIGEHRFVPNDISLDENSFLLITGPNMAGKSTYMRQAALISIMAQAGSFVPASEAQLVMVDRVFTRVGASDDIFAGQSTFMTEMVETANILNNATEKSLVILDEIGRGTATFDGMSIAAAVSEYIYEKIKARTLFATHYHEITQLAKKHPKMRNLSVSVIEEGDHITFLHKIAEKPADKSYGIQVAKLAGLPAEVISRAKRVYDKLEMVESDFL